jgi:predicted flap endonuclease-1-like 5' DNA nuclease
MNKNSNHTLITWIGITLGAISSLILFFILWRRPTGDHEILGEPIPKIKLPNETELDNASVPLVKKQPKLSAESKTQKQADDLKKIEGIGPKISRLLNEQNITTFAVLAKTEIDDLKNLLAEANIRIADPATWPEQAVYAAKQDWQGLKAFQDKLKGGRRTS